MWRAISNAVDGISRILAYLSGAAILAIAIMQMAEIVLRNAAGISLRFVWEYASYLHIAAIFLGAAFTLRTGGHIRVILVRSLTPRSFEVIATLVGLAISAFLTMSLLQMAWGYAATGRTSGTINDVPLIYPAALVAFGAAMLTLQLVLRLAHVCIGREPELSWHETAPAD